MRLATQLWVEAGGRALLALAALGLASGCSAAAPSAQGSAAASAQRADRVTYEVRSWGRLMLRWQVRADGTGEIWKLAEQKDRAEVRKYRLRLHGDGLRDFLAAAERVRAATRRTVPCRIEITDMPYGSMTWDGSAGPQTYAFNAGCRSARADAVMELIRAADAAVESRAAIDADPYATEPAHYG